MAILGQRGFVALVSALLLIVGAILGQSGAFPTVDGVQVTPDSLLVPSVAVLGSLWGLFQAISKRVTNETDPFRAGDILAVLTMREFWVYFVGAFVWVLQSQNVKWLDSVEAQNILISGLLSVGALVNNSWGSRPSGTGTELPPSASDTATMTPIIE